MEGGAEHDYTRKGLEPWADYISEQAEERRTLYVYVNNGINVRAPENAKMLMRMIGEHEVHLAQTPRQGLTTNLQHREPRSRRLREGKKIGART